MEWIGQRLDTTWKRILAAGLLSGLIIMAISVFAESSYVQTQKVQQESNRGQHCERWSYQTVNGEQFVTCAKWPDR